jgi:hypothetical protein
VGGQRHALAALPLGKTRYPLYRRLGGPQGRSGQVRKISPPPGFDPRTVQPVVSRYTNWATRPTQMNVVPYSGLSQTFLEYLFISFVRIGYWQFIAVRYKFKRSMYFQELLVIGGPPIWRVAANILNKQSHKTDKGWSSSLRVGRGANNSSLWKWICFEISSWWWSS